MLVVEPAGVSGADEELGSVGVRSGIGHGKSAFTLVLESEVLVLKLLAIDRLATGAVSVGEVTSLTHELGDHTMEGTSFVAKALLTSAESPEVIGSERDDITPEFHDDTSGWSIADFHVKEDLRKSHDIVKKREQRRKSMDERLCDGGGGRAWRRKERKCSLRILSTCTMDRRGCDHVGRMKFEKKLIQKGMRFGRLIFGRVLESSVE